jgi:hypothetical protein
VSDERLLSAFIPGKEWAERTYSKSYLKALNDALRKNKTMTKFATRLDQFPPALCRVLARVPRSRPLTGAEVAQRSGLPLVTVEAISQMTDWSVVPLDQAMAFLRGCGLELDNARAMKRVTVYLRGKNSNGKRRAPLFSYLKRDAAWATYYKPLLAKLAEAAR